MERQKLPEQKAWDQACERASHFFGVTVPALPTLANLQKLHDQVTSLNKQFGHEVTNYVGKLRTILPTAVGDETEILRYKTAAATNALCQALQRAKKPLDTFDAIQGAGITVPSAMGEVFKQAAKAHAALNLIRLDVFEKLGQVQDEPRAGVAKSLRQQLQDALRADEHATALDSVVSRWLDDSMKLLLDAPRPQPAPAVVSVPDVNEMELQPVLPPPPPPKPGIKVSTGQRKVTGKKEWHALSAEIDREVTDDAELELTWRIVKKLAQ